MIDHTIIRSWISVFRQSVDRSADHLNLLDAALGDGDFGASMQRGLQAAETDLASSDTTEVGGLLAVVGSSIVSTIGGTSGPLVGTLFLRAGAHIGSFDTTDVAHFAKALRSGADGVSALGGAGLGDKTMLDALYPALDALDASIAAGDDALTSVTRAAATARDAAQATADLVARRGRASYTGTGGVGHVDPGAEGVGLLFAALVQVLATT